MAKKKLTPLQQKRKKFVTEKIVMQIIHFVLLLAPLASWVIFNRETYFTYKNGLSVSLGGILSAIIAFFLIKKQFTIFSGIWKFVIVFALCYFFQGIMNDAVFISGAVLLGYFLSMWFINPINKRKLLIQEIDKVSINQVAMAETVIQVKTVQ